MNEYKRGFVREDGRVFWRYDKRPGKCPEIWFTKTKFQEKQKTNLAKTNEYYHKNAEKNAESNRARANAWYEANKEKAKARINAARLADPKRDKERKAKWYQDNREKVIARNSIYAVANKDKINARFKHRLAIEPIFAMRHLIRCLTYEAHRRNGYEKGSSTEQILGCSFEVLQKHIESRFKPDMNWLNHGAIWEVDHIIPLSSAQDSLEATIKLGHYTNLQPLYKEENRRKSDNLSWQAPGNDVI